MAHYDYLYEDVTADTIEEGIIWAEYRLVRYKVRVDMVEKDLSTFTLSDTSVNILKNSKEMDEFIMEGIQESIEKMSKLLERVRNGESVTYQEFISAR
ncbi:hypothetical protein BSP15_194 [Bacillus phage BSP15]|nr:hypothetical protein BSP15_194 [Bacillus phage BSP15]